MIWNINVIGDQSFEITNGEDYIYKESDWLNGEGVYSEMNGYRIPTLPDLWKEIEAVSAITELRYSDFCISRYSHGFVYTHASGYKDIVSDATAKAQDLLSFIETLDRIITDESAENGSITEHNKLRSILASLDAVNLGNEVKHEH